MAKGYLALEITPSRIRFIHMVPTFHGYQVMKTGILPHTLNTLLQGDLTRVINEMLVSEKISPKRLFVTICRQGNLIRQMMMPRMNKPELDEVVTSEIEKLPAFSNHPYDYIYSAGKAIKDKMNVVFAAVDQNTLTYVIDECRKLRIPFEHLEMAPLNIKEILPLKKSDNQNQAVLIIQEQMSYLMMLQGKEYRFIYQTGMGLQHLDPSRNGQIVESVLSNFVGELQRVIKSYLSEHKMESVNKFFMVWDAHRGAHLNEMIGSKLGVDCSALTLVNIPQFKVINSEEALNPVHVLYALPMIIYLKKIKEQFALNHFFRAMNIKRYALRCVVLAGMVIGLFASVFGSRALEYYQKKNELSLQIESMAAQRQELILSSQELYQQRDEYLRTRQGLLDQATFVKNLNRVSWSEVLSVVAEEMPDDLALTSFKFNESGSVAFFGDALGVEVIAELIRRIDTSAILHEGKFDFLTEKMLEEERIYSFGILAQLQSKASEDGIQELPETSPVEGMEVQGPSAAMNLAANIDIKNEENHEKTND